MSRGWQAYQFGRVEEKITTWQIGSSCASLAVSGIISQAKSTIVPLTRLGNLTQPVHVSGICEESRSNSVRL